jgi:hypothetical protein
LGLGAGAFVLEVGSLRAVDEAGAGGADAEGGEELVVEAEREAVAVDHGDGHGRDGLGVEVVHDFEGHDVPVRDYAVADDLRRVGCLTFGRGWWLG